ncbi:MAG: DUF1616 domain-containing protein [Methanoregula sp.]|jgi:uncharacterized membrane protein
MPDLVACAVWLCTAIACIYIPVINQTPVRILFALPVVLFIPGYALIAALFPDKSDIDLLERIALSFGLSIAVVPLIGLGLNYTPWGIRLDPIVISLGIFTAAMLVIAQYRRALVARENRFYFPYSEMVAGAREELFPKESSRLDRALSVILVIAILAAVITTIYVIAVPKEGEKFTEFFILGENKMAADYPSKVMTGTMYPMYIGVGNHEYRNISYTVEVWNEQMDFDETTNTSSLKKMDLADRFMLDVGNNATTILPYTLSINRTGYNRVEFLLYNETIPNETVRDMDRVNQSYRDLHLWVTVYRE